MSYEAHIKLIMSYILHHASHDDNERVTADALLEFARLAGVSPPYIEHGLVVASERGWISVTDDNLVLMTENGYASLAIANDNAARR